MNHKKSNALGRFQQQNATMRHGSASGAGPALTFAAIQYGLPSRGTPRHFYATLGTVLMLCAAPLFAQQEPEGPPPPPQEAPPAQQPTQPPPEQLKTVKVTAEGYNRDDALKQALRKALEEGAGVEIAAYAQTENYALVRDTIYSRAFGIVTDYKILREEPSAGGAVIITLEARVRPSAVARTWGEVQNVLDQIGRPKIMVWIDETIDERPQADSVVESRIEQMFIKVGFDIVERRALAEKLRRENDAAQITRDPVKLTRLAREAGAHILVRGSANANRAGLENLYGVPASFYNCDVQAKAYYTDTGRLLVSESLPSTRAGVRSRDEFSPQAAREALVRATFPPQDAPPRRTPPLAVKLFEGVMEQWSIQISAGGEIELEVEKLDFKTFLELKRALADNERVRSLEGDFSQGTGKFRIKALISAPNFAELLTEKPFAGWIEVTDLKPNRIQAKKTGP